jgi:hypothetical protein
MLNRLLCRNARCRIASISGLLASLSLFSGLPARAETDSTFSLMLHRSPVTDLQPANPLPQPQFNAPTAAEDPLNSAYPVPWNWILQTQAEFTEKGGSGLRYYRTPALVSPDGQYAAYTRIQMQVESELYRSRVTSVMFLENLQTGELRVIRAASPIADHLSGAAVSGEMPGIISILMPVSWSANGERLLSRQFEGFLSTSDATDYAVIWERSANRTFTLSPDRTDYTTAVLLGWSDTNPERVLFRAGILGEEQWLNWSVALSGQTALASQDNSIVYGQLLTRSWTGGQDLK